MVQDLSESFNEQMKLRQDTIQQQARQAVALAKIREYEYNISSMKIELDLWKQVNATCHFKIEALNEILRAKSI